MNTDFYSVNSVGFRVIIIFTSMNTDSISVVSVGFRVIIIFTPMNTDYYFREFRGNPCD